MFGVGYDTIWGILNGELAWKVLLVVMIAKFAALVISLGSGTSGGLLAPTFMWSAAMGGLFAMIANHGISVRTSFAGSVCAGGDGRSVWGGLAGGIFVHHFRV